MGTLKDQPAFPTAYNASNVGVPYTDYVPGMTKREYFAAMAMQGMLSNPTLRYGDLMEIVIQRKSERDQVLKYLQS